ncbi:MAG: hypothetical protein RLZZ584_1128 [Pseudomonadota bacterium]
MTTTLPPRRRTTSALLLRLAAGLLLPCALLGLGAAQAASQSAAQAGGASTPFSYAVAPRPAWVVPAVEPAPRALEAHPMHYRVIDEQILVDGAGSADYNHVVRVVDSAAGLSAAAHIELEFDPSYQRFTVHHLQLVRAGQVIDKLDHRRIQLLQREAQLERRMYDGRVTFSVVLDDVRVGDEIDFAYTVHGANPVFGGRFVAMPYLASFRGPVALHQVRLLAPRERDIRIKVGPADVTPQQRELGALRETILRREAVARLNPEPNAPYNVVLPHIVQLSEFADWAEVSAWGQGLFADAAGGAAGGARVAAVAEEIRQRTTTPAERVLAALRFVQQDVRYFGTEIGTSSHRPAPADQVIEQRFGDCKDKVALLVALLRQFDIAATPVLVSSAWRGQVTRLLPGPLAFDHVIARVDLEGQFYFLDATRAQQTGPLAQRQAVDFHRGLALDPAGRELASLPPGYDSLRLTVHDRIRFERFGADPVLEARITYRGILAEALRNLLASSGAASVQDQLSTPYTRTYPQLRSLGPMEVIEAGDDDAITFVLRAALPEFFRFPEERALLADIVHWPVIDALAVPRQESRRDPLAIAYPGIYRHQVTLDFPDSVTSKPVHQPYAERDAHYTLDGSFEVDGRRAVYKAQVRVGADQIEPGAWRASVARLQQLQNGKLGVTASVSAIPQPRFEALRKELQAADEAVRARKLVLRSKVQNDAYFRTLVLGAQLQGGRLAPALQAQALVARGVQLDLLGRHAEARADFEQALALRADVPGGRNAAAVNAMQLREFDRALGLADQVLAGNATDHQARNTRALVSYLQNRWPDAQAEFTRLADDTGSPRRAYTVLWLALATRQAGQDTAALAQRYPAAGLGSDWPRPLVDYALGSLGAEELLEAARTSSSPQEHLCEAYYYIAERHLAEGTRQRAIDYWRKAVDTGIVEYIESGAARLRLAEFAPG